MVAPGGGLTAKADPDSALLGAKAEGALATVATPAGPVVLRHPDALAVDGVPTKDGATYAKALPGDRDLIVRLLAGGFAESVVLPDAKSAPSYRVELALPDGVAAAQEGSDVELRDAKGEVLGRFGSGLAFDGSFTTKGPPSTAPLSVVLLSQEATVATVEVALLDPAWLTAPERLFPVTLDPTFEQTTDGTGAFDTWIGNGGYADTSFAAHGWLVLGSADGGTNKNRSFLRFDTSSLPTGANVSVIESHLQIYEWYSYAGSCAPRAVEVRGLAAAPTVDTTWNLPVAVDSSGLVSTQSFARHDAAGSTCPGAPAEHLDTTSLARRWLTDGATNYGLELRAASDTDPYAYKAFYSAEASNNTLLLPTLFITHNRLPAAATPAGPANGVVLVNDSPVLMANPVTDPDGDRPKYWFRVGTGPNVEGGHGLDSGWIDPTVDEYVDCPPGSPTDVICWKVPGGALSDGLYSWHVFTADLTYDTTFTNAPDDDDHRRSFRIALRLGSGGPAPTDSIGPVQANLASGNVAFSHAGPRFPTVGGDVGVGFAYNSAARTNGLLGEYYPGAALPAATVAPALTRTDPNVAFYWGDWGPDTAPAPTMPKDDFVVRWSGNITVPSNGPNLPEASGDYTFFAATSEGIRIFVDDVLKTDEAEWTTTSPLSRQVTATSPVSFTAGTTKKFRVEYKELTGGANIALGVIQPNGKAIIVPPSWFTAPTAGPLPAGWTLSAGSALAYTSARLGEHGVTLTDATGGLHTYAATGDDPSSGQGYTPPYDEDGTLARAADGTLTLTAPDGVSYVFDASGSLRHATTALDNTNQASPRYLWVEHATNAAVARLEAISDPVSGRQITLRYRGYESSPTQGFNPDLDCPTVPTDPNLTAPPAGKLCQIDYWDGTLTRLWYNAAGQLARISEDPTSDPNPAPTEPPDKHPSRTDLAYGPNRRLATVRDPLANEAMRVGVTGVPTSETNDTTRTLITYVADRVTRIVLPVPYRGDGGLAGARPGRDYTYGFDVNGVDQTTVGDDGPAGDRSVTYDPAGRALVGSDATGVKTKYEWDAADRLLVGTAGFGTDEARSMATIFDDADDDVLGASTPDRVQSSGRVTHSYGPAEPSCFSVANNVVTVSCTDAPHTFIDYDRPEGTASTGLALSAWDNRDFSGAPKLRSESVPSAGTLVGGDLTDFPAGAWSGRYTGEIDLVAGDYDYAVAATGGTARLFVDDTLVADTATGGSGTKPSDLAGRHRFRVDFSATAPSPQLVISWKPPGGGPQAIDATALAPRWANPTGSTSDDSLGVPAAVARAGYTTMAEGMGDESIVDPAGLNLKTVTAYEASGDSTTGRFRRPLRRTLPAGDPDDSSTGTVYGYYSGFMTPTPPATQPIAAESATNPCPGGTSANQGGRAKTTTGPDPDGTGSLTGRVIEVVYDSAGRVVASHIGAEDWSCLVYDRKGRLVSRSFPADADQGGHIYTFTYDNPMIAVSKEGSTTLSSTVSDMVGRVVSYTDRWNKTTDSTYDQSGRRTISTGPAGTMLVGYDAAGRVDTQTLDTVLVADAGYNAGGEQDAVTYYSGLISTSLAVARQSGTRSVTALTWTGPAGTLASDEVCRSRSGKVVDQRIDGSDAFADWRCDESTGANFEYDAAGRLEVARVAAQTLDYGFATSGGCGTQDGPGRNANRSSVSLNAGPPTTYCYDRADRLTSSSDGAVGSPTYDSHGNAETLGTQGWSTTAPTATWSPRSVGLRWSPTSAMPPIASSSAPKAALSSTMASAAPGIPRPSPSIPP